MGLFVKKKVDPMQFEYSGSNGRVYILDEIRTNQSKLKELRRLVTNEFESDITVRELTAATYKTLVKYHNQAESCFEASRRAITADAFFKKWNQGIEIYQKMIPIEQHVYNGIMPSNIGMQHAESRKQIEIRRLVDRIYAKTLEKVSELSTEKARERCYRTAVNKLMAYSDEYDEATIKKIKQKFKKYIPEEISEN